MATPPRPIASYYTGDPTVGDSLGKPSGWTLERILEEFREAARSQRDMGDRFERLMVKYLKLDPTYDFSGVWLWMDWPGRGTAVDTGIDIVAQERITGDYWAVQCKFYHPEHTLSKRDIDSFFTTSGKAPFKHRLIISTTDNWSENAKKALEGQHIQVQRIGVQDLENSAIDWGTFRSDWIYGGDGTGDRSSTVGDEGAGYQALPSGLQRKPKKELRPHQQEALEKVIAGLQTHDRGKLIMACGTGKTFTSLKIAESWVGSPPAPLDKGGEESSKVPLCKGDLGGSGLILFLVLRHI